MKLFFLSLILWIFNFGGLGQSRMLVHLTRSEGLFSSRVMMVNSGNEDGSYTLTGYGQDGLVLSVSRGSLSAQHTVFHSPEELFHTSQVSHVLVESGTGIHVLVTYQLKIGGSPAQVPESSTASARWQFFSGDGQTVTDGFALVNLGDSPLSATLQLKDSSGTLIHEEPVVSDLAPMAKALYVIDNSSFPGGTDRYFILECSQQSSLMALRFQNPDQRVFWQVVSEPLTAPIPDSGTEQAHITLFYTNDEHGWMEPNENASGAAGLTAQWKQTYGYEKNSHFLIISGGDMWTGPAISTWTKGEAMVDVMNHMGYQAAALGNHEFDFGLDMIGVRAEQADFPFLSSNIRDKQTGALPDFVAPFWITQVDGVQIGFIGLTTTDTPSITFESITGGFDFLDYEVALREFVPIARQHGAKVICVLGHVCGRQLEEIETLARDMGISLLLGGHCHQYILDGSNTLKVVEAGSFMRSFAKIDMTVNRSSSQVTDIQAEILSNQGDSADSEIESRVAYWQSQTAEALGEVIGYASQTIPRRSNAMGNLITDAWLTAFPGSRVAMCNTGGVRQDIPAGEITVGTILGVLPFENAIMEMTLTGNQIIANISCCYPLLGGMTTVGGYQFLDGTPLDRSASYLVLATDYMYEGNNGFIFQSQDPDATATGILWQQPVVDWIRKLGTTAENPINNHLDNASRY